MTFLGGGPSAGGGSSDYILTARQVTTQLQYDVAEWLSRGNPGYEEAGLLEQLRDDGPTDTSWVQAHADVLLPRSRGGGSLGYSTFPRLKLGLPGTPEADRRSRSPSPVGPQPLTGLPLAEAEDTAPQGPRKAQPGTFLDSSSCTKQYQRM